MTFSPPPLTPWNATNANRCTLEQIVPYWEDNDTLTFLVDLDTYHPSFSTFLDHGEKEHELRYKTAVSRKRFVVSRTFLKHILRQVLGTTALSDIILIRKKYGRILIDNFPGIYISLSYSGTWIAITVAKRKTGSDIEVLRPMDIRKVKSCPLFYDTEAGDGKEHPHNFLQMWTLLEASSKLRDRNTYACLTENDFPPEVIFVSYCVNNASIFSLASASDKGTDVLLWLDTAGIGVSSEF